jgi:hypothetical protein
MAAFKHFTKCVSTCHKVVTDSRGTAELSLENFVQKILGHALNNVVALRTKDDA